MAGTRRSRVSDTSTHRHQRSVSHTASTVEIDAETEVVQAVEIAESADEGSPRPVSPFSRSTKGFCRNCRSNVGEFYNSWYRITGSYYVPALLGSYKSLLKITGKQKAASNGTDLEGCTIQPLSCPALACNDSPIGFTVVDAPAGKRKFRNRDFFKLNRIELQCDISPNETIVVEPQENVTPDLLTVEDSASSSPDPPRPPTAIALRTEAMEVESRPPMSHQLGAHRSRNEQHHEHAHLHQPLQQVEANRQPLPSPSSMRSPSGPAPLHSLPMKAAGNPLPPQSPALRLMNEAQRTTQISSVENAIPHHSKNQYYPRSPGEVSLDAIERLQTQISQNSGALAAHTRDIRRGEESFQQLEDSLRREFQGQLARQNGDIRRVDEVVGRLHHEMQGMRQVTEGISRELQATRVDRQSRGSTVPPSHSNSVQDSALELMAQQIAVISRKANEVDTLRITIEILKNKIQRLEEGVTPAPSQPTSHPYEPPQEPTAPSSQSTHAAAPHHPTQTPVAVAHIISGQPPTTQTYRSFGASSSTSTPELSQRPEPVLSQSSGWAAVNAGVKRTYPNDVASSHEATAHTPGSPKRQRLATVDPHASHAASQGYAPSSHDQMDIQGPEARAQSHAHTLPYQHSQSDSMLASQSQHSVYVSFGTQDGPSDDSWRPESQRIPEHRPRGRGRGGGPGSRGGRGRKSMPAQLHPLGTPEWEKDDWQGVPESQTSPDGYYNHVARSGRGIARRGSGGGVTHGGYAPSDRAASLGLQGMTASMSSGSPGDPYAHTKKTRTKPIRNSDGILIRKDGRPDMRSQSSAANLRKVHARKEGDSQESPSGFTPTNLHYATSVDGPDTPSPSGYARDQDVTTRKHNAIMDKMFPSGVDESRKQHDYTRQIFEDDLDHTRHPRAQNRHQAVESSLQIKKEQAEQSPIGDLHPLYEEDVDMDREGDPADDEGQTSGQQSDKSGRGYHEARQQEGSEENRTQTIPETQAVDSSPVGSEST